MVIKMTKYKYILEVGKRLKCSPATKKDIKQQLESDIDMALENGENINDIIARMGSIKELAKEFNENLPEEEIKAAKKRGKLKLIAVIAAVLAVVAATLYWYLPKQYPLGEHFIEEEVQERAEEVINLLDKEDYAALRMLCSERVQKALFQDEEIFAKAKEAVGEDWGEFKTFGEMYMAEIKQMGKYTAVVQVNAVYGNTAVTYTISFDENLNVAGLFMR